MLKRIDPFLGIFTAITFWSAVVIIWHPFYAASPLEMFLKLLELLTNKGIYIDIFYTLSGAVSGLLLGSALGITSGILMGFYLRLYHISSVVVDFIRSISPPAFYPLFIIIFGIGILPKIALIALYIAFIMLMHSFYGVIYSSKTRKKIALLSGASNWDLFRDIIFPEALTHIFAGMRIAVSISLVYMITFEMVVGSNYGLGYRIFESSQTYQLPELYATIFILGCLGYCFNKLVLFIEKKKLHWVREL